MPSFLLWLIWFLAAGAILVAFCLFFDQAILTRHGTVFRVSGSDGKRVALTFDDGPSPIWTPRILDALRASRVKATFFMLGHHVRRYPQTARRVAAEGHEIGNHGYAHNVMLYYTPPQLEAEVLFTDRILREVTGRIPRFFRPPKAWLLPRIRRAVRGMGYEIVLWSLNSKDWVMFDHRRMAASLLRRVRDGDIILFHDSGNVFTDEGGDRSQTAAVIPLLVEGLRERGFSCVTVGELLERRKAA